LEQGPGTNDISRDKEMVMNRRLTGILAAVGAAAVAIIARLTAAPLEMSGFHSTAGSDAKKESHPIATENLNQRGKQLRAAFEDAYRSLRASGKFGGFKIDVTPVVLQYISIGTSFDDAEAILQSAGFFIFPHPDLDAPENGPQNPNRSKLWYAVTAWINPFDQFFPSKISLDVLMLPKSPGDYTTVDKMLATFVISSL
jgi:hypothetical protein